MIDRLCAGNEFAVYDVERAAAQMRSYGDWAEPIVFRIEHGFDSAG